MAADPYLEIGDEAYPLVTRFMLPDAVLVEEVTGLAWLPFLNRARDLFAPSENGDGLDHVAFVGVVAISVSRKNPRWRRDRVVRFIQDIEHNGVTLVFPEDGEADDADPPTKEAGSTTPSKSASSSESGSDSTSEASSRESSGTQESPG